jgi:glycerophosphoryl diester phosphodiesterase
MTDASVLVSRPVAHRGLHDAAKGVLENTISAARAAVEKGFAIECDVQRTSDGESVVFHDFTLDRLTVGRGKVADLTASALAAVAFRQAGDRIPTLAALLDLICGKVPLVVEIKSAFDGDLRLTKRTLDILGAYAGPLGVKSFDPVVTKEARRLAAGRIPCGVVAMQDYADMDYAALGPGEKHALANLLHYPESRPDFISWKVNDLPCAAPFLCSKVLGLPLMAWTVRTEAEQARAKAHADQMVFEGFAP